MTLLRISSLNKKPESDSNTDFKSNFGNGDVVQVCNKIVVKSIDIPNVFYNLRDDPYSAKTSFTYKIAGVPTTITLPEGQYTDTQLIDALKANTTLSALGFDVTISPITYKLTFTTTTAIQYLNLESGNGMAPVLGILEDSVGDVLSYTATGLMDLSGVQEIYITSPELSDGSSLVTNGGQTFSVLAHIPMTVNFNEIEHWRAFETNLEEILYPSYDSGKSIRDVSIQVRDRHGDILDLHGLHITIILKAYQSTL
jgi:hypothetical protein